MASTEAIRWLQDVLPEAGLAAFAVVTHAGSGPVYGALAGILALAWDRRKGLVLAWALLVGAAVNAVLKAAFAWPRPPEALHRVSASGFGFPSGHAQANAVFWGTLARLRPRRGLVAGGAVAVVLVATSRVVLGVHYPRDVVAGVAVGLVVAAAVWAGERWVARRWDRLPTRARAALALVGPLPLAAAGIYGFAPGLAGALAGAGVAYVAEEAVFGDRPVGTGPLAGGLAVAAPLAGALLLVPRAPALDAVGGFAVAAGSLLAGPRVGRSLGSSGDA